MKTQINIEKIEDKQGAKSAYRLVTCRDNTKYSCFKKEVMPKLKVGLNTVELTTKGDYTNITGYISFDEAAVEEFAERFVKDNEMTDTQQLGELPVEQSATNIVSEKLFRINIKQNSKGAFWDVTARGDDLETLDLDLRSAIETAIAIVKSLPVPTEGQEA